VRVGFGLRVVMVASLFVPLRPDIEMPLVVALCK